MIKVAIANIPKRSTTDIFRPCRLRPQGEQRLTEKIACGGSFSGRFLTGNLAGRMVDLREFRGYIGYRLLAIGYFDELQARSKRSPITSHLSHQWAAAAPVAFVFLQSQMVADPIRRMTPSARKHSLYAMTNEFV